MPYSSSGRLPAESASKLGHLELLNSELVKEVTQSFDYSGAEEFQPEPWHAVNVEEDSSLPIVFAVDGSFQIVGSQSPPYRELGFVKTALLRLDPNLLRDVDPKYPHPHKLRNVMKESALYHATVFPLRGVEFSSCSWMDGVRGIIRDSLLDPNLRDAEVWETLKWLLYKKWTPEERASSPDFECPGCNQEIAGLSYDAESGTCPHCGSEVTVADVIGLHMEMLDDGASQALATSYMAIHEVLLIFSAIRHFWNHNRRMLARSLFMKDGPLSLRGQYSKLVPNIRHFLSHAFASGWPVHLVGQEKSGAFFDHLQLVHRHTPPYTKEDNPRYFLLSHDYIRTRIQRVRDWKNPYGKRTNYGEKVFVKLAPNHSVVLNVATGEYQDRDDFPSAESDFIGFEAIMATLPQFVSHLYEGALYPIELANGVASLSSYPSAQVLKVFAGIE